jgi:hypothetical protein
MHCTCVSIHGTRFAYRAMRDFNKFVEQEAVNGPLKNLISPWSEATRAPHLAPILLMDPTWQANPAVISQHHCRVSLRFSRKNTTWQQRE